MKASDWISTNDEMPEPRYGIGRDFKGLSEYVLVYVDRDFTDVAIYDHQESVWYDKYDNVIEGVKYWASISIPNED